MSARELNINHRMGLAFVVFFVSLGLSGYGFLNAITRETSCLKQSTASEFSNSVIVLKRCDSDATRVIGAYAVTSTGFPPFALLFFNLWFIYRISKKNTAFEEWDYPLMIGLFSAGMALSLYSGELGAGTVGTKICALLEHCSENLSEHLSPSISR